MNNVIEFRDVSLSYDGKEAVLLHASFALEEGKMALFSGPSGCGKSTIGKLISGIIPEVVKGEMVGKILIRGEETFGKGVATISKMVATVLQDVDSQIVNTIVEDELAFGMENFAIPQDEIQERTKALAKRFKLDLRSDTKTLSGGQKQKLVIASALAMGQRIILLDEPLCNLDKESAVNLLELLRNLTREGYTVVLFEHRLDIVLPFVDAVYCIKNKRVERIEDIVSFREIENRSVLAAGKNLSTERKLLSASGLTFSKQGKTILKECSLTLKAGEKVLLLGENGCGKTTLLRCLAKLERIKKGRIHQLIDPSLGQGRRGSRKYYRKVGVIYQNPNYQLFMSSVEQEVLFGAIEESYGRKMMELFNLTSLSHRHPHALSEGQKRRLAIASVMASRPEIVLLDEPTVGQDGLNLQTIVNGLLRIHEETGNTMLTITHDRRVVEALSDRVMILRDGRIAEEGGVELAKRFFSLGE